MLTVCTSYLRSCTFTFCNVAEIVFKFFEFWKYNIFSNITHAAGKTGIKNINRCSAKVNKRADFCINLCLHYVYKGADIVLCLFFFSINFLRVDIISNLIQLFCDCVSKLTAHLKMSLYEGSFTAGMRANACFFRNVLRKAVECFSLRQRVSVIDTRQVFKNVTSFHVENIAELGKVLNILKKF